MNERRNAEYYRERERIERDFAARSTNPQVAKIHVELADSYARLAVLEESERRQDSEG